MIDEKTGRTSKDAACVPLLCCRYVRHKKGHPLPYQEEKWVGSLHENMTTLRRETTSACIDYVHDEILEKHGSWLAGAYVQSWRTKSQYNREGYFKPGFLVPLPLKLALTAKKMPGNAMPCANREGGCTNPGTKACAGCRSCHYCSVECQKQHWQQHKKVCGKSAADLSKEEEAGSGMSVVVPVTGEMPGMSSSGGMYGATVSTIGGITGKTNPKDLYRNIHGDRRFLVKIQTGLKPDAESGLAPNPLGALMVYDMTKSFTFHIMPSDMTQIMAVRKEIGFNMETNPVQPQQQQQQPQSQHHPHRQLFEAITTRGVPCMNLGGRKGKGYFWARREGANLRIFVHEQEPMQPW